MERDGNRFRRRSFSVEKPIPEGPELKQVAFKLGVITRRVGEDRVSSCLWQHASRFLFVGLCVSVSGVGHCAVFSEVAANARPTVSVLGQAVRSWGGRLNCVCVLGGWRRHAREGVCVLGVGFSSAPWLTLWASLPALVRRSCVRIGLALGGPLRLVRPVIAICVRGGLVGFTSMLRGIGAKQTALHDTCQPRGNWATGLSMTLS